MQDQDTQTPKRQQDLGARRLFRQLMQERRAFRPNTLEHQWRTKACVAYLQLMRGVPAEEWKEY
jgi:hypothetical protein